MGMFSEIAAYDEVIGLSRALRHAMNENNPDVIQFCKTQIYPLFYDALSESFNKNLYENTEDIRNFFEKGEMK